MKLQISESFPGELNGDPNHLLEKAAKALETALEQAGVTCCGALLKAGPYRQRGGELQLIEDLAKGMGDLYSARLEKLQADLIRRVEAASE